MNKSLYLRFVLSITVVFFASRVESVRAQEAKSGTAPATLSSSDGALQEILVTAERRSERLQDVPIDVSVLTAAAAQKVGNTDTMTLPTQIPTLQTSRQVTGFTAYLRGVGTISGPGEENAVATYVDDVYINGYGSNGIGLKNLTPVG